MTLESVLGPLFPLSYFALFAVERVWGGRPQPQVRRWGWKGVSFFVLGLAMNVVLPPLIAGSLAGAALLDLGGLGLASGFVVVFLAATLADYWVHRAMHRFPAVWRWTHQMHHSAERVDMAGFAYAHPFELAASVAIATLVGTLLGAPADAVLLAGYVYFVAQLFLHMEIRTPRWIGWFVQRPEGHRVHHTRGVHAYNYGLPLWDAVFGTRRNPKDWDAEYGFWDGASRQMAPMLLGRDVGTPPTLAVAPLPAAASGAAAR